MKIKFEFNKKFEDFEIVENLTDLSTLREKAKELTKARDDSLILSFIDIDNEEMVLRDQHDFEYFIENAKENLQSSMVMVKSIETNNVRTDTAMTPDSFNNANDCLNQVSVIKEEGHGKDSMEVIDTPQNTITVTQEDMDIGHGHTGIKQTDTVIVHDTLQPFENNVIDVIDPSKEEICNKISGTSFKNVTNNKSKNSDKDNCEVADIPVISLKCLNLSKSHSDISDKKPKPVKNISENFQLDDYLEVNDNAGFNDTVFKSGKLDFMRDISAILPNDDVHANNQIYNNYKFMKQHEKRNKNASRDTQKFTLMEKTPNPNDHASLATHDNPNQKTVLDNALANHPKIKSIESKLDILSELFMDGFASIREEMQTSTQLFITQQSPMSKDGFVSGVKTRHMYVSCDHCKKANIIGKRFKCLECWDFDICEACEALNVHTHPMMRVMTTGSTEDMIELNKVYRLRKKLDKKADKEVKKEFLKILTKNGYGDTFYEHMVANYSSQTLEQFMMEMIKIFA